MKKLLIVIVSFFVFVIAQTGYTQISVHNVPGASSLSCASSVDEETVCVGGAEGIWRSTNAGVTWNKTYDGIAVGQMEFLEGSLVGYALSGNTDTLNNISVLKTVDGGLNWIMCYTTPHLVVFMHLYVKSANEVFANFNGSPYGSDAQLYHSVDGGLTWSVVFQTHIYAFTGVTGDDQGNVFASGSMYWSSADLITWQHHENMPVVYAFTNTEFANNRLYVGGDTHINNNFYPRVSFTTNHGDNWTNYTFPDSGQCWNLTFAPNGTGYTHGTVRGMFYSWVAMTTDAGNTWERIYGTPSLDIKNICASSTYMYAVGIGPSGGIVVRYRTTLTGTPDPKGNLPKQFELQQNYPNPFNPETTIKYRVPEKASVELSIFDSIGRHLKTINEGVKNPGSYNVRFNGANLSSGIYFYKIQAGGFSETKKMMLIK